MAELRSTDIIDKLSKLNKKANYLQTQINDISSSGGESQEGLKQKGVVFQINANGNQYQTQSNGIINLGNIGGLTTDDWETMNDTYAKISHNHEVSDIKSTSADLDGNGFHVIVSEGHGTETKWANLDDTTNYPLPYAKKSLEDDVSGLSGDVSSLSSTVGVHTTNISSLSSGLEGVIRDVSSLTTRVGTAEDNIADIGGDLIGYDNKLKSLNSSVDELAGQVESCQSNITTINTSISALETDINKAHVDIEVLQNTKANKTDVEAIEQDLSSLTQEIECDHVLEITGVTGHEYNLAIDDQQMLLNKIQGQSFVVNQLIGSNSYINNDYTDNAEAFRFSVLARNEEWHILNPNDAGILLTKTNFKLEGIVTLPSNMKEFRFKHNGLTIDLAFGYVLEDTIKSHSNHKVLYSMFVKSCNVTALGGVNIENIMLIDLTQMFGAGKEPTTVKEFYSRYGNGYIPYNEGEFKHSQCNLISRGRNIWNEEWEYGYLDANGNIAKDNAIRSKDLIPVLPNTTYYIKGEDIVVTKYDINKKPLGYIVWRVSNVAFNTPSDTYYIRIAKPGISSYQNDICINVSDVNFNGTYEPYKEEIFVVNQEFKAFDYAQGNKKTTTTSEEVDLGTLDWVYSNEAGHYRFTSTSLKDLVKKPSSNSV